jgi:branched-chain amino acid transport system ATP-binding protein
MNEGSNLLQAKGLTMRFGGVVAVDNVDFAVRYGELRCLIGPNGAGKSTFFKMLSGQLKPTSGDVLLKGNSIVGLPTARIASLGVGIKTQVPSVFDGMTVRESVHLAAGRTLTSLLARKRTTETLERMRIAHLEKRLVGELAHGQRQIVELAMVVAPQPDLILLDEPAAGMTGDEVAHLASVIVDLACSSAVIVVEHDMKFIRRIAKVVTVFSQGKVLSEGPAADVLADQRVRDVYLGREAS